VKEVVAYSNELMRWNLFRKD